MYEYLDAVAGLKWTPSGLLAIIASLAFLASSCAGDAGFGANHLTDAGGGDVAAPDTSSPDAHSDAGPPTRRLDASHETSDTSATGRLDAEDTGQSVDLGDADSGQHDADTSEDAPERCDGMDDSCDGELDEGLSSCDTCADGDGCCPQGCYTTTDSDCALDCRDGSTWPPSWTVLEDRVFELTNRERARGAYCAETWYAPRSPLTLDERLREAARCHALDMADNEFFSHTSSNGDEFTDRINATGYPWVTVAENIGIGYSKAAGVVDAWMRSPSHCVNVMSGNAQLGVGYVQDNDGGYKDYWTQEFGLQP